MQSERAFTVKVMKKLRTLDRIWLFKTQEESVRGIPDVIGSHRGKFFSIEFKKDKYCKPDPLQEYTLGQIRKSNGLAFYWHPDNWEEQFEEFFLFKKRNLKANESGRGNEVTNAKCRNRVYTQDDLYSK